MPTIASLTKKIRNITANDADEPDLYGYIRDLLVRPTYGIEAKDNQVVVDSKLDGSLRRPDLVVYRSLKGKALRGPDYALAVFEVKKGDQIEKNARAILREKRAYVQSGTTWFFLIDQRVVTRINTADREAFGRALEPHGKLSHEIAPSWSWTELADPEEFKKCFGVLSADALALEGELHRFRHNLTPYQYLNASGDGRSQFGDTVREASEQLREAVATIIQTKAIPDLKRAIERLKPMIADYGAPKFDWFDQQRPISFERMASPKLRATLTEELVVDYERRREDLMADLDHLVYALRLEHDLFQQYAERNGVANASLLKVESDKSKPNARLLQSLAYETGSLILSRMLTIRFCEDYGLFRVRYISNGGIDVFWRFAEHFDLPMQELLRQTYRHAHNVFRSIFDANLLDWAVRRDDPILSVALERTAFVLSRWDFRTVRGDILSGVYDQYLDVSQRRRLGEVYTRPEVARFMLKAAGWSGGDNVLDPACGTGTFLVEALVQRLDQLSKAGAVTAENVRDVVGRLHGLDISSFSIALAQIQVFWHLIDVLQGKSVDEIQSFARSILPSLPLHGGWSSLDAMGQILEDDQETKSSKQLGMTFRLAYDERTATLIPPGFERVAKGSYDLVVMNPPYVRPERTGSADYGSVYKQVAFKNTDTSIYFIYRALRHWVKPGGRLAFIVPIGMSEAAYAGKLRRVLQGYRIKLIADLEGLGKATFRGVKRPTIIVVVEHAPSSQEDSIEILQLDPTCLIEDVIDFDRATRTIVKRYELDRLAYVPAILRPVIATAAAEESPQLQQHETNPSADPAEAYGVDGLASSILPSSLNNDSSSTELPVWVQAMRSNDEGADAMLTKLRAGDAEALKTMSELPRLGEIVRVLWVRRDRGRIIEALGAQPTTNAAAYRPELMLNYGVKLGGEKAFRQEGDGDCIDLYKGQNIFPQGLLGEPLGQWSTTALRETTRYIYSYSDYISYEKTFAVREISQLPTAAVVQKGNGFQNTATLMELIEEFPLNGYLLSRVVQFYAARVLRSSIIEDLGCHWYKRTLTLLPLPPNRTSDRLEALRIAGQAVMDADSDIADRYRQIDALIALEPDDARTVNSLILRADQVADGIDLNGVSETKTPILHIQELGEEIRTADLFFRLVVPNAELRAFISFTLMRSVEDNPDAELGRGDVLTLSVPKNLSDVVSAIRSLTEDDLEEKYREALDALDKLVAEQCGISNEHRDHMIAAMTNDAILSQMRPMIAQRGLRVQPYVDHSESDRYG
ncbi:class I SAM-dependent DNA methyltransferase [Aureimonas sp. AU4]|uniref:HsdM family class I SAM-dependent methyltransferase n=1 Tax=Aureimonas sp. AU4 TaxID=1638163 RepID=UPI000A805140|nr:N-6 DNA methylase [Aureimonas sp. AU4]